MAKITPRKACKFLLVLCGFLVYYFLTHLSEGGVNFADDFENQDIRKQLVVHPQLGVLKNIEDFWTPGKEREPQDSPGEMGKPVETLESEEEKKRIAYSLYGFNQHVSDKISLHRSIPDTRHPVCKERRYPVDLPRASVVIIFHNEGWSTLMRTVHSVLDRSPPHLLEEIVLVDDFSDKDHLKKRLEEYVEMLDKVRLVRTSERVGLIQARTVGAKNAVGDVVIFLDSHCEANTGWLPPLLERIGLDHRTCVCPIIDFIDHNTFTYRPMGAFVRGTFSWRFDYKERQLTKEMMLQRRDAGQEVKSPVMAGGLFAISRKFFEELGYYDPGMFIWGGENYELSFKIWMCGGQLENIPCSRVGHVYRHHVPYKYTKKDATAINFRRVAEVWMDEYKHWLYDKRPSLLSVNYGDISERVALRKRLGCKSFKWFMENVANDTVKQKFEPVIASGEVRNVDYGLCLDSMGRLSNGGTVGATACHGLGGNQDYLYSFIKEIRQDEHCLDVSSATPGTLPVYYFCHELGGNQHFELTKEGRLFHASTRQCLTITGHSDRSPSMQPCGSMKGQTWKLQFKNRSKQPV